MCAFIACENRILSIIKRRKIHVNVMDIQLLLNLIVKSSNYVGVESWFPFCLAKTDPSSFFNIYVNYLFNQAKWFTVAICLDRNHFHLISGAIGQMEQVRKMGRE